MSSIRLALMGIGNLRCGPAIVASLATFYWERPLEIRMYDSDPERLVLMDRLARVCFLMAQSNHGLMATVSPDEALEDASLIVLSVGENCARKLLGESCGDKKECIDRTVRKFRLDKHPETSILSLQREPVDLESYYRMQWPAEPSAAERASLPFQILRWVNGEEYPLDLIQACEKSPFKAWLENPTTAEYVGRP